MIDPTQPIMFDATGNSLVQLPDPQLQEKEEKLLPRQEEFCKIYTSAGEFFGNGVQTYIEVYEPDTSKKGWYKAACSAASQILSNTKVCKRINELLEDEGLNDQNVDKQLLFLINQHADLKAKGSAIKEYNQLKARIINRLDHTTLGDKLPETKTIILDTRPKESA